MVLVEESSKEQAEAIVNRVEAEIQGQLMPEDENFHIELEVRRRPVPAKRSRRKTRSR